MAQYNIELTTLGINPTQNNFLSLRFMDVINILMSTNLGSFMASDSKKRTPKALERKIVVTKVEVFPNEKKNKMNINKDEKPPIHASSTSNNHSPHIEDGPTYAPLFVPVNENMLTTNEEFKKGGGYCNQYVGQRLHFRKRASERAKTFDEKHQLSFKATKKVVSLDQKVGLSEMISARTILVNGKVKEIDEKYQVSQKTKSAISVAE
ncbi:hypothetical protein Fmac_012336 [Flemingia macrophylla]|uniref:Uncharacterized protein n=1 Tax=Flemingia macrophylla TaxID=520843 RepID=A0ABD1MQ00_9FABA